MKMENFLKWQQQALNQQPSVPVLLCGVPLIQCLATLVEFIENCDVAAREDDGPNARYVGVADWAIDTEEANKLWEETERTLASL